MESITRCSFQFQEQGTNFEFVDCSLLSACSNRRPVLGMLCRRRNSQLCHLEIVFPSSATNLGIIFVKGAPDLLLARCTSFLTPSGDIAAMTPDALNELRQMQRRWSMNSQRVLLLARRVMPANFCHQYVDASDISETMLTELTSEMVAVGMIGIIDPPRPEIPNVVRTCRGGGIRIVMVHPQ
jgi:magnesium-transporting ATPase (P-type)